MSFETMALADRLRVQRIIDRAVDGEYPPDGVYENEDARLEVRCSGKWVNFAWKHVIPFKAMNEIICNGEFVLATKGHSTSE